LSTGEMLCFAILHPATCCSPRWTSRKKERNEPR
jgi:hypothetical protein